MKLQEILLGLHSMWSRPARGAWVEISIAWLDAHVVEGRAPRRARGLKSGGVLPLIVENQSRPARGAWIEIFSSRSRRFVDWGRTPREGV